MAKDTQIIVRVPGEFNLALAECMFLLQDKGVHISKADLIIQFAVAGCKVELESLRKNARLYERG